MKIGDEKEFNAKFLKRPYGDVIFECTMGPQIRQLINAARDTKDCMRLERWITAYCDDELDAVHILEVEAHLDVCEVCRERKGEAKVLFDVERPGDFLAVMEAEGYNVLPDRAFIARVEELCGRGSVRIVD